MARVANLNGARQNQCPGNVGKRTSQDILETRVILEIEGQLAILAPVAGHGVGSASHDIVRQSNVEDSVRSIDLDLSRSRAAPRTENGDANNPDVPGRSCSCWRAQCQPDKYDKEGNDQVHFGLDEES